MATATDTTSTQELAVVPLRGLSGRAPVNFPLFIQTAPGRAVLYQPSQREFAAEHEDRLMAEGIDKLWIREQDRQVYSRRVERELDNLLRDRSLSVENRAAILAGVAAEVASDVFEVAPDKEELGRARQVMASACNLVMREHRAFDAVRGLLTEGTALAEHSMTVGMLSIGLARRVLGDDPGVLLQAGLGGLLHDVGRVGHDPDDADQRHTARGYHLLKGMGMAIEVCDAALLHHERFDGSGFPDGLVGTSVPQVARIVGLVDTFQRVYTDAQSGGGVFNALRVMAQVYRGCFDPKIATAFVQMFGG